MEKIYIGIDPGKSGAIVIMDGENHFHAHAMPSIGKTYDAKKISDILKELSLYTCHCVIEDVHAIYGASASATFEFGYGVGLIEGILVANGIPFTKVQPKKWQKVMWEGIKLQTRPSSSGKTDVTDTKSMSKIAATRLFPDFDFRENSRCKNPHDGIIDAVLIAEYGRRMRL